METHGQRIGNGHEATLTIGLHIVFLAADVDHHLAGLRSLNTEIGTTLAVNLRELVAGDGILDSLGICRHLDFLGHLDIGALGLKTQMTGYCLAITATQFTIAGGVKVQTVRTIGTIIGRDDLSGVEGLGEFVDLLLTTDADTLAISLNDITSIEVHFLGF